MESYQKRPNYVIRNNLSLGKIWVEINVYVAYYVFHRTTFPKTVHPNLIDTPTVRSHFHQETVYIFFSSSLPFFLTEYGFYFPFSCLTLAQYTFAEKSWNQLITGFTQGCQSHHFVIYNIQIYKNNVLQASLQQSCSTCIHYDESASTGTQLPPNQIKSRNSFQSAKALHHTYF